MKYLRASVIAAIALSSLLVASQAHAVSETFFFTTGANWTLGSLNFTSVSGNQTVTANATGNSNEIAVSAGFGLVICSAGNPSGVANGGNCSQEQHYIDNANPGAGNEFVRFVFSEEVTLLSLTASFVSNNDDFALRVGGANRGNNRDFSGTGIGSFNFAALGGDKTDNNFRIGAAGGDNNDNFKLRSLTVEFQDPPPPPPPPATVPEPSTILLLGSGLAGLGLWRMRKQNKA